MKKTGIIVLVVIIALAIGAYLYLGVRKTKDFEPQIKAKLSQLVKDASNGLYKLEMGHIEIDVTAASLTAKNVLLSVDSSRMLELENSSALGSDMYEIFLEQINFQGLSAMELLNGKDIDLASLTLDSPKIRITHKVRKRATEDTANIYERLAAHHQSYSIGNLLLNNIQLTFINLDKNKSVSTLKNVSASFIDIKIDSSTKNDSTRFLFARDAVINVKGFKQLTQEKRYHFNIDSIALRPQDGNMHFFDLTLKPEGTKEDFSKIIKYQQDRYDLKIKKGTIKNINWFSLLAGEGFYGDEMMAEGATVNIYHDRSLPAGPPKSNNFPHQLLMNAGTAVSVKKILLRNMTIMYEELNPKSMHSGVVSFYNVNGEINNVTNIKDEISKNSGLSIIASADFLNEGKLNTVFRFDLANASSGNFSVDATLGQMQGAALNKITEGLALIKIKSVTVDKLQMKIKGSNKGAGGKVMFAYHDLEFDVLKNDDGDLKKRAILSFIANKLMVNKSNPGGKGEQAKQFTVLQQHDTQRSFFNLIWKTLLAGILKTVK